MIRKLCASLRARARACVCVCVYVLLHYSVRIFQMKTLCIYFFHVLKIIFTYFIADQVKKTPALKFNTPVVMVGATPLPTKHTHTLEQQETEKKKQKKQKHISTPEIP